MPEIRPLSSHPLSENPKYGKLLQGLTQRHYRECRRDGNCLYTSIALLLYPLLRAEREKGEGMVSGEKGCEGESETASETESETAQQHETQHETAPDTALTPLAQPSLSLSPSPSPSPSLTSSFLGFTPAFDAAGVASVVYECYFSSMDDVLSSHTTDTLSFDDLTVFVAYLRLVCSTHAILNEGVYQNFIEKDIKKYCAECIDPMEQRAGEFEVAVLADALKLRIRVISVIEEQCLDVSFGEGSIEIKILHTPDHFEPIYD